MTCLFLIFMFLYRVTCRHPKQLGSGYKNTCHIHNIAVTCELDVIWFFASNKAVSFKLSASVRESEVGESCHCWLSYLLSHNFTACGKSNKRSCLHADRYMHIN